MKKTAILQTLNYKQFRSDEHNRSINRVSLQKIVASMEKHGWLEPYPIHVVRRNGILYIIDGQHRYRAAEKLGIPVLYVVCPDREGLSVAEINLAQSKWTLRDFVASYANQGISDYIALLKFAAKHDLQVGVSAKLMMNSIHEGGMDYTKALRKGEFKVADINFAEKVVGTISALRKIGVSFAANRSFVNALMRCCMIDGFCVQQFIDRVRSCPSKLTLEPTEDRFVENIEEVYNHRSAKINRLPIKFLVSQLGRK
jgi:hypothetical protein